MSVSPARFGADTANCRSNIRLREGEFGAYNSGGAEFSTFAARPLLNVHDIVVVNDLRAQGIDRALLGWVEQRARQLGCCKLTLEVLSENTRAMACYQQAGFAPYVLDPAAGNALLVQKYLTES